MGLKYKVADCYSRQGIEEYLNKQAEEDYFLDQVIPHPNGRDFIVVVSGYPKNK